MVCIERIALYLFCDLVFCVQACSSFEQKQDKATESAQASAVAASVTQQIQNQRFEAQVKKIDGLTRELEVGSNARTSSSFVTVIVARPK